MVECYNLINLVLHRSIFRRQNSYHYQYHCRYLSYSKHNPHTRYTCRQTYFRVLYKPFVCNYRWYGRQYDDNRGNDKDRGYNENTYGLFRCMADESKKILLIDYHNSYIVKLRCLGRKNNYIVPQGSYLSCMFRLFFPDMHSFFHFFFECVKE